MAERRTAKSGKLARWSDPTFVNPDALTASERKRVAEADAAWDEWRRSGDTSALVKAGLFPATSP